jgi:hypothetical protein
VSKDQSLEESMLRIILQFNLLLSILDRVGSVADVKADSQSVVTTDGT